MLNKNFIKGLNDKEEGEIMGFFIDGLYYDLDDEDKPYDSYEAIIKAWGGELSMHGPEYVEGLKRYTFNSKDSVWMYDKGDTLELHIEKYFSVCNEYTELVYSYDKSKHQLLFVSREVW